MFKYLLEKVIIHKDGEMPITAAFNKITSLGFSLSYKNSGDNSIKYLYNQIENAL